MELVRAETAIVPKIIAGMIPARGDLWVLTLDSEPLLQLMVKSLKMRCGSLGSSQ